MNWLLPSVIILCFVLMHIIKKSDKETKKTSDAYFAEENKANQTRKKNLDTLDYIQIPLDRLPFGLLKDDDTKRLEERIKTLSREKILNLTGITNTDLKLTYGAANLPFLSECDLRFTSLVRDLYHWADSLYALGYVEEAVTILAYGVSIGTDIRKHYTLLGEIYASKGDIKALDALITSASTINGLSKDPVLNSLNHIKSSLVSQ